MCDAQSSVLQKNPTLNLDDDHSHEMKMNEIYIAKDQSPKNLIGAISPTRTICHLINTLTDPCQSTKFCARRPKLRICVGSGTIKQFIRVADHRRTERIMYG